MSRLAAPAPVAVVGAGTMGAGIAQVAALAGHPVLLLDSAPGQADAAVARVHAALDRLVTRGRLDAADARRAQQAVTAGGSVAQASGCALVVEAAVERLDVKQEIFAGLEAVVGEECVLATNTSSLSVTDVAARLRHPGRCVGMHFFNPPTVMRLVEVVSGRSTDPRVAADVAALARAWGKVPVQVTSTPGFVVNRVARPFYGEALRLLEQGVADAATIDAVLRESGGFPMGPLELTDLIGQDVNLATTRSVWEQLGRDPRFAPSRAQQSLVDAGHLGRKAGRGVYRYDGDATPPPPASASSASSAPRPEHVMVAGDWGPWAPLWDRVRSAGVDVRTRDQGAPDSASPTEPVAQLDGGILVPTDGWTATDRASRSGCPVVVLDLALEPAAASRFAVAPSAGCPQAVLEQAVGLLQATGAQVSVVHDVPGLLVARTVAMLVDEATEVTALGVAGPQDVDTAMRLGAGYPIGPLEWGDRLGAALVVSVLDALAATEGDARYRVCPTLREHAALQEREAVAGAAVDLALRCAASMWAADAASRRLGMELSDVSPGHARLTMRVVEEMLNGHGTCHGGYLATLADSAFAFACNTYDDVTVAAGFDITFAAPACLGDELVAEATERVRYGRSGVYDVTVSRVDGTVIAEYRGRSRSLGRPLLTRSALPDRSS